MRWLSFLLDARCVCFHCDSEEEALEATKGAYDQVFGRRIKRVDTGGSVDLGRTDDPPRPWSATYEIANFDKEGVLVLRRTNVLGRETERLPKSLKEERVTIARFHGGVLLKVRTLDWEYEPHDGTVMLANSLINRGSGEPRAVPPRSGQRVPTGKKVPVADDDD